MFTILKTLLSGSSLAAYAVLGALLVAGLGSFGWYEHHAGYTSAEAVYQAKIDTLVADYKSKAADETERQDAINDASKAAEARAIADLQATNDQLEQTRKGNADEASKDPDANKPALGADSVRRLNAIH